MFISVVLCTYNGSDGLGKTLASLRNQSVPEGLSWELILVDNNSTDNTRNILEEFVQNSGLQVHYLFELKQGRAFALNTGIRNARGDIIAFTDDDVILDSQWLSGLADTFSRFDCSAVGGRIIPVWNQPQPICGKPQPRCLVDRRRDLRRHEAAFLCLGAILVGFGHRVVLPYLATTRRAEDGSLAGEGTFGEPAGKKVPAGPIGAPGAARSGQPRQRERPDG